VAGELASGIARMISLLPKDARRDLRRLLSHELAAPASEIERGATLTLLCELIETRLGEIPTVEEYERERQGATCDRRVPAAATLSRRYGGWIPAVAAAAWLTAGGSGAPPATELRDPLTRYSRVEALASLDACRRTLEEWPTPAEYAEWRRIRLRLQRRFGDGRGRTPGLSVFRRLFGGIEAAVIAAERRDA
jgi:hypothetical protein